MTDVEKLKLLTGEKDADLLTVLLEEAASLALSYTGRSRIIPGMEKAVRDLAVTAYNRMGTEGESSRSGGGESYSFDNFPPHIYDTLSRYRLARVGGKTYEAKTEQDKGVSAPPGDS